MTSLANLMASASKDLEAGLRASREAFTHSLTKGEAVEAAVREFFRRHYPTSVGVAKGQVIDADGATSRQLDVILYDETRTPILFSDRESGARLIPCEGVIAAVESKTVLKIADVPVLADSARLLKSMNRSAYYASDGPIVQRQTAYGREWPVLPPMYFVFAFEGPALDTVAAAMDREHSGRETHQRIDLVCILDKGVVLNETPDRSMIDTLPAPGSVLCGYPTSHALLLFHILISRYVLQARIPPIALQRYLPHDFVF